MKYGLIYADPPWQYDNSASRAAAENHYSTMSLTDLKRLPVWDLAADDCVLAMWWVPPMPVEAIELAQAWGFRVKNMCMFTWAKLNTLAEQRIDKALSDDDRSVYDYYGFLDLLRAETRMGMGNYTRGNAENVLVAVRGRGLERISASVKQLVHAPVGEHSAKPDEVRRRLNQLYGPVPRIELFSRGDTKGWDHWGDEATANDVNISPAQFHQSNAGPEVMPISIPDTGNDVWPEEVHRIARQIEHLADLPADQNRKVMQHINHLLLDRAPSGTIIVMAQSLASTFKEFPNA